MDKEKLLELCDKISKDVEQDAKDFNGKPLDGKTVATYFGYHGAAINALANILKEVIKSK